MFDESWRWRGLSVSDNGSKPRFPSAFLRAVKAAEDIFFCDTGLRSDVAHERGMLRDIKDRSRWTAAGFPESWLVDEELKRRRRLAMLKRRYARSNERRGMDDAALVSFVTFMIIEADIPITAAHYLAWAERICEMPTRRRIERLAVLLDRV